MKVKTITVSMYGTNCYLAFCPETKEAVVVDPGAEAKKIIEIIKNLKLNIKYIINTHGHVDHIGANGKLKEALAAPVLLNEKDLELYKNPGFGLKLLLRKQPQPDQFIKEGDRVSFGKLVFEVIETPGHTRGGICLLSDDAVFCGDTLFAGSVGRTDLAGGSYNDLIDSIRQKLLVLSPETTVYPGHGPQTTIGLEARSNPFVGGAIS